LDYPILDNDIPIPFERPSLGYDIRFPDFCLVKGQLCCFSTVGAFLLIVLVISILIVLGIVRIRFLVHRAGLYFRLGRLTFEFQDLLLQLLYPLLLPGNPLQQRIH